MQNSKQRAAKRLSELFHRFQHLHWRYREEYGEPLWELFDGKVASPNAKALLRCKVLSHREEVISALPKGGVFAEVGTLHGDFAVRVLDLYRPSQMHILDLDFGNLRPENATRLETYGACVFHLGDSSTNLTRMAETYAGEFDVIYIDGDHSYDGAWKDLVASLPLLKTEGWLLVNDYTLWDPLAFAPYGVYWAVNRFVDENELVFEYLALEPQGFHDVALRRAGSRRKR